jgi:hypothetical protein
VSHLVTSDEGTLQGMIDLKSPLDYLIVLKFFIFFTCLLKLQI